MQHPCYTVFEQQLRNIDWATTVALDVAFIVNASLLKGSRFRNKDLTLPVKKKSEFEIPTINWISLRLFSKMKKVLVCSLRLLYLYKMEWQLSVYNILFSELHIKYTGSHIPKIKCNTKWPDSNNDKNHQEINRGIYISAGLSTSWPTFLYRFSKDISISS